MVLEYISNLLNENLWAFNTCMTTSITFGCLFCVKAILKSRRPRCLNNVSLLGRTCIVTGANTGIGKASAEELARRQARVIMACRDTVKGQYASDDIKKKLNGHADTVVMELDLGCSESIKRFCEKVIATERVDILVCNAGIYGAEFNTLKNRVEVQFGVNHLGHFLLTNMLKEKVEQSPDGRIIIVSSTLYKYFNGDFTNIGNEATFPPGQGYARSKLANILFANELSQKTKEGVSVNSMSPGMARTELGRYREKKLNIVLRIVLPFLKLLGYFFMRSAEEGAQTIIYLATEPALKGSSGKFYRDCRVADLQEKAKDPHSAQKLWEISSRLTNWTET